MNVGLSFVNQKWLVILCKTSRLQHRSTHSYNCMIIMEVIFLSPNHYWFSLTMTIFTIHAAIHLTCACYCTWLRNENDVFDYTILSQIYLPWAATLLLSSRTRTVISIYCISGKVIWYSSALAGLRSWQSG